MICLVSITAYVQTEFVVLDGSLYSELPLKNILFTDIKCLCDANGASP